MSISPASNTVTTAVKHLLIVNILFHLAKYAFQRGLGVDLVDSLGLHYVLSSKFGVWQFLTFSFLHADISHLFFNMFALFMFGRTVEMRLGTGRFVVYYLVTAIGSGVIQNVTTYFDVSPFIGAVDNLLNDVTTSSLNAFLSGDGRVFSHEAALMVGEFTDKYNGLIATSPDEAAALARQFAVDYQQLYIDSHVVIGASGAVFGILLAFGMLFPNATIFLLIPPIPLKAKWLVVIYGVVELFAGVSDFQYDNVAHWAHLGGMLFGFLLLRKWQRDGSI